MHLKRKALRLAVCASSVMAMLAWAPAHAADGKKRVHVKYSSQSASKSAVKSQTNGKQRVHVKYSSQSASKSAVKSQTNGKQRVHVKYSSQSASKSAVKFQTNRASVALTVAGLPNLKSAAALVIDLNDGQTIYAKNTKNVTPIASITKLMTAMVVLDAGLHLDETIYISSADFDFVKHTNSRLGVGMGLSRRDMLRLALMSSENRAAASLSRAYPGGSEAFVTEMNRKALELGMWNTRFVDATGLSGDNVSTAEDLVKMVRGAYQYSLIREFTTTPAHEVETMAGRNMQFRNSNGLIKNPAWEIGLSKTGYISEAGRCLVMQAKIAARPVVIVLLDSLGKQTRIGDANRIKKWIESHFGRKSLG